MKSKIVLGSELKPGDILVAASILVLLVQISKNDSFIKALEINQNGSFSYYKYYPKSQYRVLVCS